MHTQMLTDKFDWINSDVINFQAVIIFSDLMDCPYYIA